MIRDIVLVIFVHFAIIVFLSCEGSSGGDHSDNSDPVAAHSTLTWDGSSGVCLSCHTDEAEDIYASTHYQWQGDALYMVNGPEKQGKITGGFQFWSTLHKCDIFVFISSA
jgi:hypothetical protein